MAKEISEIKAHLIPDGTGKAYNKLFLQYKVRDSVNTDLFAWKEAELSMTGGHLTALQALFTKLVGDAEDLEGIV